MIRQNKKMIIITSVVTLLPILIGLLLWNRLPASIVTHFGMDGKPNGYSSKAFTVVGIPLIVLFIHLACVIGISIDPKVRNINQKIFNIVLWICPAVSLVVSGCAYGYSFGYKADFEFFASLLCGILYLILGNYIPKVKPNYTVGFRVPWALVDPDNWYHTHRFGGKCLVGGGVLSILMSPFQNLWILIIILLIPCIVPVVYSYLYYRKKMKGHAL